MRVKSSGETAGFLVSPGMYLLSVKEAKFDTNKDGDKECFCFTFVVDNCTDPDMIGRELPYQRMWLSTNPKANQRPLSLVALLLDDDTYSKPYDLDTDDRALWDDNFDRMIDGQFVGEYVVTESRSINPKTGQPYDPKNDFVYTSGRLFHPANMYDILAETWLMKHGELVGAGVGGNIDPLGDLDDHPF